MLKKFVIDSVGISVFAYIRRNDFVVGFLFAERKVGRSSEYEAKKIEFS